MNKTELIAKVSEDAGISKSEATSALNSLFEAITITLKSGGKVTLVGFGTFSVSKRAAKVGTNPNSGAKINVKAKKVARFKPGTNLQSIVGGGTDDTGPMRIKK